MENREGYRFQPTNEEIVHILEKKRLDPRFSHHAVMDIEDIYSFEPWDLQSAGDPAIESKEKVRYFFYELNYRYKKDRAHRRTNAGNWKVTSKDDKIIARNGLTGIRKILTFYRRPASKKTKTDYIMHEFHLEDNPSYKKKFVLCLIKRKRDNKRRISTPDEGESSQQFVSPTQQLPSDELISSGNHLGLNNARKQNIFSNTNLPPNLYLNTQQTTNPPQVPDHNTSISYPRNVEENTPVNPHLSKHSMISVPMNHIEDETYTELPLPLNLMPQQIPDQLLVKSSVAESTLQEENLLHREFNAGGGYNGQDYASLSALQSPNYPEMELSYSNSSVDNCGNLNSRFDREQANEQFNLPVAFQYEDSPKETEQPLTPDFSSSKFDGGTYAADQLLVKSSVAENTLQEENLLHREFNAGGGYNGQNYASLSAPQSPNYLEMELSYSNSSVDNCGNLNSQFDREQANERFNLPVAFQYEDSPPKETEQPLTPDFSSSKFDGGTYAADQLLVKGSVAESTLQEEILLRREFNAGGGYNGQNYASLSAPHSPNYLEMELSYSNSSVDNCGNLNSQFDREQANERFNLPMAFQYEDSPKETERPLTPDCSSSKSGGGTHAADSSDTNTESYEAWFDKQLLETIA